MWTLVAAVILTGVGGAGALDQTAANSLAGHLLGQLGKTHGVAEIGRVNNGTLALALVQNSQMLVHATDPDLADVNVTRTLVEPTGVVGTQFYVERAAPTPSVLADNTVDLYVLYDLRAADMASVSFDAVKAALCPGGRAYIGRASAEGAGLSAADLTSWSNGKSGVSVTTDAQGVWAVITRSEQAGTDVWTHRFHGPDNNPASQDAALQFPFLVQYRIKPYQNGRYGSVVTSNGRMFIVFNDQSSWPTTRRFLRAYNIYNGQMLWSRYVTNDWPSNNEVSDPEVYPVSYSAIVARGDDLYMLKGGTVLRLAGETGTQLGVITFATGVGRVKWIAIDGDLLYALIGDSAMVEAGAFYGNEVRTYNLATSTMGWSQSETGRIDNREIAISGGKLFYYVKGSRVVCRNALSGAQVWQNTTAPATLDNHGSNASALTFCVGGHDGMLASTYGVYLCSSEDAKFVALSAADGTEQYQTAFMGNRAQHKVLSGTVLFAKNLADHEVVNATTAQAITSGYGGLNMGAGCGPLSTSRDWMFGQAGGVANRLAPSFQSYPYRPIKADCSTPAIISNGMAIFPASGCGCPDLHRGIMGNSSAGTFQFDRTAVESERLQTGPALGAVTSTLTPGSADWWTHRASNVRSGMVAVTIPSTGLQQMWKYTPVRLYDTVSRNVGRDWREEQEATPAVSIGTRLFFGGSDGYVRCVEGGAEVWRYQTGGRIYATPTVTAGCVFVGSADGYAYCLDAADGDLVWRFRGAPVERRVSLYGYLASTWPVVTGVLVNSGRAYFAAGFDEQYGTHVYCVNAATGAIVWQNNTCGPVYNATARIGFAPSGYMAIGGGKLWVRAHKGRDGIFDLNSGVMDSLPATLAGRSGGPTVRGRDIGFVDGTHLINGGRLLFSDRTETGSYARALWYNFTRLNAQGVPQYPSLSISDWASIVTPAWDSQRFYYTLSGEQYLEGWNTARLTQEIDSFQTAWDVASRPSDWPNWKEVAVWPNWVPGWQGNAPPTPMSVWRQTPPTDSAMDLRAMVLASNALVVTQARRQKYESPSTAKWYLEVLDRSTGSSIWRTRLPSEPLWGGLSLTSNAAMIVTLRTGEVIAYGNGVVSVGNPLAMAPMSTPPVVAARAWDGERSVVTAGAKGVQATPYDGVSSAAKPSRQVASSIEIGSSEKARMANAGAHATAACRAEGFDVSPYAPYAAPRARTSDMAWRAPRACLPIAGVEASSSRGANLPVCLSDSDLRTRWSPSSGGTQWVRCDLGQVRDIGSATLVWYAHKDTQMPVVVEVSIDGEVFERVDEAVLSGRGTQNALRSFVPVAARFVRFGFAVQSTGLSVYEVGVHGNDMAAAR